YRKALALLEHIAPGGLEVASSFDDLATGALLEGKFEEAAGQFEKALKIQERLAPDGLDTTVSLSGLGSVALRTGDTEAAEHYFAKTLIIRKKLVPKTRLVGTIFNLATVLTSRGDLREAEKYYREVSDIARDNPDLRVVLAHSFTGLGGIAYR